MWNLLDTQNIILSILLALCFCLFYGYIYLVKNYYNVSLFEILYHIIIPLKGANMSPFLQEAGGILLTVLSAFICVYFCGSKGVEMGYSRECITSFILIVCLLLFVLVILLFATHFELLKFLGLITSKTDIYDEKHVKADDDTVSFPDGEKKRNLIYIYLESMEMTYAQKKYGGAYYSKMTKKGSMEPESMMPELEEYALSGIDFSKEGEINGAYCVPGATFTTGAMVAHSQGITLNMQMSQTAKDSRKADYRFLPGSSGIGDVLKRNGYRQKFILGSDVVFGGREALLRTHGAYEIFDYKTAQKNGKIDKNYYVWWGYEDYKLFDYAKEEILKLASYDEPFHCRILTVDTHFLDGYRCEHCKKEYKEQYADVIACSSRQIHEFIEWLKVQDFYDNTTIVLAGDHTTMDSGFIRREKLKNFDRRTYVSYLNLPKELKESYSEEGRLYSTFDLFPTTLASINAKIKGDRLGLGVNLFSGKKTLIEEMGKQRFFDEMMKKSEKYNSFIRSKQ